MFGRQQVAEMIGRSAENDNDRRAFLKGAGLAGLGVVGAGAASTIGMSSASASHVSDGAVLNFALNLEYLEAEFYSYAAYGRGLPAGITTGKGDRGRVVGGREVKFKSKKLRTIAREIAQDEINHVKFLRAALGSAKVARPKINLRSSFTAAARAAGLIGEDERFDPYANENNFLLAAFIFEDVGVTAYKGAAPLISNDAYLEAAAGILAVEAYHAGIIRSNMYDRELIRAARRISWARDSLDGKSDVDQGIGTRDRVNLVPADRNGIAYSRTPGQVLNVVYLTPKSVTKGGFFPQGVNGAVRTSS